MTDNRNLPEGAYSDFGRGGLSYGQYLALDDMLQLQRPVSAEHDEMLFIVIHQATELWMRLMLHEIHAAISEIRANRLGPSFKMLARVSRIQSILIESWSILSTMTPADYLKFRDKLGPASGFQSQQYRELEFLLGNKREAFLAPFRHQPGVHRHLEDVLATPSLYDEAIRALSRRGFSIDPAVLARDVRKSHEPDPSVEAAWLEIYRNTGTHWELYELAEKLVDLEDAFQQWRFRHLGTVTRIIGAKRGTGGTAGLSYLKRALDYCFFPELWSVRTIL
ncbi:tryptophan 2,3-dioxygenase [Rhabdaerophilum sp.]|uniref:tryptophan 2,3-dioxygenase n=1 Tax=Rhabdaerophilum sp. TaxID=2717341 RepID=UPI0038D50A3F